MKNSSNITLPPIACLLTVVQSGITSSIPDDLSSLSKKYKNSFDEKPIFHQPLFQVHQMVKEEGNWDESWFNSYE